MSRLEKNNQAVRDRLVSRNYYNPNNIYDINNSTTVNVINNISRLVRPGNGFDFSNTVIGRIVGKQTPIAIIGNQALVNLYTEQVKSTIVRKNVPNINFNNLFTGKSIFQKNIDYSITKDNSNDTLQDKIFNTLKNNSGINSITNPISSNTTTEELISKYTGSGQLQNLSYLLSNNIYYNNFNLDNNILSIDNTSILETIKDNKLNKLQSFKNLNLVNYTDTFFQSYYDKKYNSKIYPISGDTINQQDINKILGKDSTTIEDLSKTLNEDIVSLNNTGNTFTWGMDKIPSDIPNSTGILGYTNALFNTLNIDNNAPFNKSVSSIVVNGKTYYNGIKYSDRSYSVSNQMDSISQTIRPYGNNRTNSTIKDNPIPKFIYTNTLTGGTTNTVMLSIENLAISNDTVTDLNENGPNGGRLMWFVPSIIDFNETVSPNFTPTNFLGRGEPVYTYANTERKLTFSFWIIVDHAQEFINITTFEEFQNKIYQKSRQQIDSAKTKILDENLSLKINQELLNEIEKYKNKNSDFTFSGLPIDLFYKNNSSSVDLINEPLNSNFESNLNKLFKFIEEYLSKDPFWTFDINIKSSINDKTDNIQNLYKSRSTSFKDHILGYIGTNFPNINDNIFINEEIQNVVNLYNNNDNILSEESTRKRKSSIVSVVPNLDNIEDFIDNATDEIKSINQEKDNINDKNTNNKGINKISLNDNTDINAKSSTFNKIQTKTIQNGIMTYNPEDLYRRLTFLHQCTRQGKSQITDGNSNSVFGRPPIIVFKLGDMYNTKAVITSIDFSFENEIPWDLNPEGFGVQKMGCKVNMQMNLIGGSSIDNPESEILNADSNRYYANSSFE